MSTPDLSSAPAFGQAQLSNCEREQIHLPGSIQPHGALAVIDDTDLDIVQVSANIGVFLGLSSSPIGENVAELNVQIAERVTRLNRSASRDIPVCFRCVIGPDAKSFDCFLHRTPDGPYVAEFLKPGDDRDFTGTLTKATRIISDTATLDELCVTTAELVYDMTGYDRVMVYKFDRDGHGRVEAEKFEKDIEPYLGNRYPASDIPRIARNLYLRNRVRLLGDVGYTPVQIEPRTSPATYRDLDMSMCFLRSISPLHIQYLRNMGVAATLVLSIVVGGRLWGLIACHHYAPRIISADLCAAAELVAESVATRITAFDGNAHAHVNWSVRRFETYLLEGTSRYGDWKEALLSGTDQLLRPVGADGAALFVDGEVFTTGAVPGTNELRELRRWLMDRAGGDSNDGVLESSSLGSEDSRFTGIKSVASGILAVPVSNSGGEFLVWFRAEQVRTDVWGGDPSKAVTIGQDPADLSPRRSFAQWHQLVEGTSEPWSSLDLSLAERMGHSVSELAMHFRSVRALIIEDQLNDVFRKVSKSLIPTVITDPRRHIIIANEAFQKLIPPGKPQIIQADDLPGLFVNPEQFRDHLVDLFDRQTGVRAEVQLRPQTDGPTSLMLRADPVFVADRRILGYVLMFSDMSEQKAVARARREFQSGIAQLDLRKSHSQLGEAIEQRELISTIVGNAKLAAADITDGQDIKRIPYILDSVRASVERSLDLLDQLAGSRDRPRSPD